MSSESHLGAPPPEAFQNNEPASITEVSSPVSRLGKRRLSDVIGTGTLDHEDTHSQQSLAPPPPVRRASSITGSTTSSQQPFSRPLVRRRSSLFDTLPGRSRAGSLQVVPESTPPSFLQRLSQNSTLLAEDVTTSNLPAVGTPQRRPRGSLFGAVMEKLGTKASPQKAAAAAASFMSPSGKSILNIVNRITSPFRFHSPPPKSPPAKRRLISSSSPLAIHKQTEDSQSSLHDDDNWREAPIHNGQAEILDWTLKRKIQLECHPPEALETMWQTREWRECLGYWIYHPISPPLVEPHQEMESHSQIQMIDKSKSAKVPDKPESKDAAVVLASRIVKRVRTLSTQNNPQQIWQQSLRSLFFQWRHRVEAEENLNTAILDCYFYCIAEDHVVLFRVDMVHEECNPRVLLSKCCEPFRQLLRDHGVESMAILKEPAASDTFKRETNTNTHLMSPTVKADLEALRKAQAFGEVAGADVSIKIKGRKKASNTALVPQNLAITLTGHDDVATFFEVYFNVMGRVQETKETDGFRLLPKLVCPRTLGPFWHASLEYLHARPVKPESVETMPSGILEIQGEVILPCLIRRLVALSASQLSSMPSSHLSTEAAPLAIQSPSKENVGSHFVVFHTIEEASTNLTRMKSLKLEIERLSILFNGINVPKDGQDVVGIPSNTSNDPISECRSGATLQLIVWDISRSKVVACKVGALPYR